MHPVLFVHVVAATIALIGGALAMIFRKGSGLHRAAGDVFVVSMLCMTASAAYAAALVKPNLGNHLVAVLTFYLVATGWVAGRRRDGKVGLFDLGALVVAFAVGVTGWTTGLAAVKGSGMRDGYPASMYFVFGSIAMLCAFKDVRVYVAGGVTGSQRIGRHLRRLGLSLVIAVGSFYPGQAKLFPKAVRETNLLLIPLVLAIGATLFWMARVQRASKPSESRVSLRTPPVDLLTKSP